MAEFESVAPAEGREAKCSKVERGDRLSSLPDSIVHRIFSFLKMDDISRFGSLSKNCRQMFLSTPYLKLGLRCDRDAPTEPSIDRVNRLLSLRSGSSIHSFALRWRCEEDHCINHANPVHNWIDNLVSCGLEELDIDGWVRNNENFVLPGTAFSSRFLRVLKLNMRGLQLDEPNGVLAFLEELSLSSVRVADYTKWASDSACPSLKKLTLSRIEGNNYREKNEINITSASIEELTIYELDDWAVTISADRLQKLYLLLDRTGALQGTFIWRIHAPNLQELKWTGEMRRDTYIGIPSEFVHLQKATLDFRLGRPRPYIKVRKILQAVRFAPVLELNSEVVRFREKLRQIRASRELAGRMREYLNV